MTTPDHIGADPALGVGAGQTRRSTPVDLAREVLDLAHEDETVTVCTIPDNKAAALARAVLRVADLADKLEMEGTQGVQAPNRTPHDSGWHDSQIIAAARIRDALNGGDRG